MKKRKPRGSPTKPGAERKKHSSREEITDEGAAQRTKPGQPESSPKPENKPGKGVAHTTKGRGGRKKKYSLFSVTVKAQFAMAIEGNRGLNNSHGSRLGCKNSRGRSGGRARVVDAANLNTVRRCTGRRAIKRRAEGKGGMSIELVRETDYGVRLKKGGVLGLKHNERDRGQEKGIKPELCWKSSRWRSKKTLLNKRENKILPKRKERFCLAGQNLV